MYARFPRRQNTGTVEHLTVAFYPYRRAAMTRLRALRAGRSKGIVGTGTIESMPYVATGSLAVPLIYDGPTQPELPERLKGMLADASAGDEIFVTYVPCITGHKNRGTWEENVHTSRDGMIDPVLFAMAVYAVGDVPRLYQRADPLSPIAVVGTGGTAIVAPMRKPEGMPQPETPMRAPMSAPEPRRAARTPRAPRAPRAAPIDPSRVMDGHERVDPYLRFQPYKSKVQPALRRFLDGTNKDLKGWGEYDGKAYATNGHMAIPGYTGPKEDRGGVEYAPNKQKHWNGRIESMPEVLRNAEPNKDSRELTVESIPDPEMWDDKERTLLARSVRIAEWGARIAINPRLLGLAILAVGPKVRLFQPRGDSYAPVAVEGEKGLAVVMPLRLD
jgi:hypothetical protein